MNPGRGWGRNHLAGRVSERLQSALQVHETWPKLQDDEMSYFPCTAHDS